MTIDMLGTFEIQLLYDITDDQTNDKTGDMRAGLLQQYDAWRN